jgi:signal transduction histidine kinase/ActR/RegA family two-component response regulator
VDIDTQIVLIALVVGMAASGSILLAPLPSAAILYATTILAPTIGSFFLNGGQRSIVLGCLAVSFWGLLLALILVNSRLFLERMRTAAQLRETIRDLQASREETDKAAQAKSDFLATMSHEIRTPLTSIIGYANLIIERNALRTDDASDMAIVRDASKTLLAVVNDILDFSMIEKGKLKLISAQFELAPLLASSMAVVAASAREKGLQLLLEVEPAIAKQPLLGDAERLRQVLLNLLNNAIKFTAAGSVAVRVTTIFRTDEAARVRIEVADTGLGIPPSGISRLFQRFSQLDAGSDRAYGGSGLGLAICKGIVESHNGTISVESTVGVGSTFSFEIPFEFAPQTLGAPLAIMQGASVHRRALHLLVVDDMEPNRRLTKKVLDRAGHNAQTASSGEEAIAKVRGAERFDVILMDLEMPGMNGLAATRELKRITRTTPVIGMTANVLPKDVARCYEAGMVAHIGKPFELPELVRLVESVGFAADAEEHAAEGLSPVALISI